MIEPNEELLLVDEALWLLRSDTGLPIYDFPLDRFLPCRRPWQRPPEVEAVARVGAFEDYTARHRELLGCGIRLVHTPEEHLRCSDLTHWYPLIEDLTPRSFWFDEAPDAGEVGDTLGWPVFVKGARQTSRHRRSLSIIDGPGSFSAAMAANAEVVDSDRDAGGERRLILVRFGSRFGMSRPHGYLHCHCPSTGRAYLLRVPPETRSCHLAAAWLAGFDDPEAYRPIVET